MIEKAVSPRMIYVDNKRPSHMLRRRSKHHHEIMKWHVWKNKYILPSKFQDFISQEWSWNEMFEKNKYILLSKVKDFNYLPKALK